MKIRYILVDDDPKMLSYVKGKIDTIAKNYDLQHIASYDSSKKASETVNCSSYDLLFVDYEMPVYNGLELAKIIAENKKIIFLTSTKENEQNVINTLDIAGFMSKPFDLKKFETILKNKIIGKIQPKDKTVTSKINLSVGDSNYMFKAEDAYYITTATNPKGYKANKNYVSIYGKDDEVLIENVRMTISNLSEILKFTKIN